MFNMPNNNCNTNQFIFIKKFYSHYSVWNVFLVIYKVLKLKKYNRKTSVVDNNELSTVTRKNNVHFILVSPT
jgi:hypothetical protein